MCAHIHDQLVDEEIQFLDARLRQARFPRANADKRRDGVERTGLGGYRQGSRGSGHAQPLSWQNGRFHRFVNGKGLQQAGDLEDLLDQALEAAEAKRSALAL
jgi:hypothetical protein